MSSITTWNILTCFFSIPITKLFRLNSNNPNFPTRLSFAKWQVKVFEDEFTVHVISSILVKTFDQNTLASIRNFLNDEIRLSGNLRVTLNDNIVSTKVEHITNGILISYILSCLDDHQRNLKQLSYCVHTTVSD